MKGNEYWTFEWENDEPKEMTTKPLFKDIWKGIPFDIDAVYFGDLEHIYFFKVN